MTATGFASSATRCIPGGITTKFNFARSMSWHSTATIYGNCRYRTNLERLLARRPEGIFINPFERGEIGPDLFRAACGIGLEGLVSNRRDRPY
jgi:hypothetical protein